MSSQEMAVPTCQVLDIFGPGMKDRRIEEHFFDRDTGAYPFIEANVRLKNLPSKKLRDFWYTLSFNPDASGSLNTLGYISVPDYPGAPSDYPSAPSDYSGAPTDHAGAPTDHTGALSDKSGALSDKSDVSTLGVLMTTLVF